MPDLNRSEIIGHAGADVEIKSTPDGTKLANFSVATDDGWFDKTKNEWQSKTNWHRVVAWRQLADKAEKIKKGDTVFVSGKSETRSWDKDGEKRYITEIIADKIMIFNKQMATKSEETGDDMPF